MEDGEDSLPSTKNSKDQFVCLWSCKKDSGFSQGNGLLLLARSKATG